MYKQWAEDSFSFKENNVRIKKNIPTNQTSNFISKQGGGRGIDGWQTKVEVGVQMHNF